MGGFAAAQVEPRLPNPATCHIPQLDGIRGLAIALVLLVHCYDRGPDPRLDQVPGGGVIEQLVLLGWAGVELFFVLSGLLVTSMLLSRKRRQQPLGPFYARRMARIVPAYLAVISLMVALSLVKLGPLVDPITAQARMLWPFYALFLNNYFGPLGIEADEAEKVLGPLWSVATEMQFYLLWPPLVMALSERKLKLALPLVLGITVALRLAAICGELPPKAIYAASSTHLDGIIAGSLLALHWDRIGGVAKRFAGPGLALTLIALVVYFRQVETTVQFDRQVQSWGFLLVAVASSMLILLAVSAPWLGRLFSFAPLRTLGRYSYFIYLIHFPMLLLLDQLDIGEGFAIWVAYCLLVTAALTGIGALAWRFFEQPIIDWNKRRERGSISFSASQDSGKQR